MNMNMNQMRMPEMHRRGLGGWSRWLCAAIVLWCLALGAWAQGWGLQLRDAPGGQAADVVSVSPGSPAAAAGIRAGDRILQAQNFLVRSATDFENIVRLSEGRGSLLLRVSRDGWEKELNLIAGAAAAAPAPAAPQKAWIGLQVADPLPDGSGGLPSGAVITGLASGGPAAQAGLKPGDVIMQVDGRRLANAAELAATMDTWPAGRAMRLTVQREGWMRDVTLVPGSAASAGAIPPASVAPPAPVAPPAGAAPPVRFAPEVRAPLEAAPPPRMPAPAAAPSRGSKALVSIGDFQVKAASASPAIGDGMREMLVTALHTSGSYVVVERMDLQGLAAEQALSRSRMAREGSAVPEQRMDVADIIVYGAVTEFEGEAKGSTRSMNVPTLPFSFGRDRKTAHMALDVRVVDVASGRILGAQRIAGDATSSQTTLGGEPSLRGVGVPVGLGMFQNTPMEFAIRSCVERAVAYVSATVPSSYFSHR